MKGLGVGQVQRFPRYAPKELSKDSRCVTLAFSSLYVLVLLSGKSCLLPTPTFAWLILTGLSGLNLDAISIGSLPQEPTSRVSTSYMCSHNPLGPTAPLTTLCME